MIDGLRLRQIPGGSAHGVIRKLLDKLHLKRKANLTPAELNLRIVLQLLRYEFQPVSPLIDDSKFPENRCDDLVSRVRLPALHVGIVDGRRKKSGACNLNHVVIDGNLDVLSRQRILAVNDGVSDYLPQCLYRIFPARHGIDSLNRARLVDVPKDKRIRVLDLLGDAVVVGFPVNELASAESFEPCTLNSRIWEHTPAQPVIRKQNECIRRVEHSPLSFCQLKLLQS